MSSQLTEKMYFDDLTCLSSNSKSDLQKLYKEKL